MSDVFRQPLEHLQQHGYVMLESIFDEREINALSNQLSMALESRNEPSILRSRGQTYGSRNLLEVFPELPNYVSRSPITEFTTTVLGRDAGIVRALYFDKPPDRSWSLPWHKDYTIAVKRNDIPSDHFQHPTIKAGVPHVEAPRSLLENVLTLRIHLDPMGSANGPLCVIPGSHRENNEEEQRPVELHANSGDVLAMRPLLSHCSRASDAETKSHRRVIHVETAYDRRLPDGYEWYTFIPLRG